MKCPYCGFEESKVIDSRPTDENEKIRRRRECMSCQKRFTTYEVVETPTITVIKKDNSRQAFDRDKLTRGIWKAAEGCQISADDVDKLVSNVEMAIQNSLEREVTSMRIGELVMDELKKIDDVAYVRFASVYREFKDINTFMEELSKLLIDKEKNFLSEVL